MATRFGEVEAAKIDEWVAIGLISSVQAEAIATYESSQSEGQTVRRSASMFEILGYVGAALVLIAGGILVLDVWQEMSRPSRVAVAAVAGALLAITGLVATRAEQGVLTRVGMTSLFLAPIPIGTAVGIAMGGAADSDIAALSGFTAAAGVSVWWYIRQVTAAQHVALFGSLVGAVVAAGQVILSASDQQGEGWIWGLILLAFGAAWVSATSAGLLAPRLFGEFLGIGTVLIAQITLVGGIEWDQEGIAEVVLVLWILSAVGLTSIGVVRDRILFLIGGMIGLIVFVPWFITSVFGETVGAPLALLVAGGLLIASAVYLAKRRGETTGSGAEPQQR